MVPDAIANHGEPVSEKSLAIAIACAVLSTGSLPIEPLVVMVGLVHGW